MWKAVIAGAAGSVLAVSILAMLEVLGGWVQTIFVPSFPPGAIVAFDRKCPEGWEAYKPIAGRFPLASGRGTDERGESVSFTIGDAKGEYENLLTPTEMPNHGHSYNDHYLGNPGNGRYSGDRDDKERDLIYKKRDTVKTGGNAPHNNMPPYLALNFCHNPRIQDSQS